MNQEQRFVGLDVHKRVVQVCIMDAKGNILLQLRFKLTRASLLGFCKGRLWKSDRVALECSTNTWTVVDIIQPYVAEVVVSNPRKTKAIAEAKIKTDKVDARVLADLLRADYLPRVWIPDEHTRELRRLAARRAALVGDRTVIKNRVHAILAQRLIEEPETDLFSKGGLQWLRQLELDAEGREAVDSELKLMEAIDREVDSLEGVTAKVAYADDRVRLLMTLPGVDVTVALVQVAALGDIRRFRDGDHAASYLGIVPRVKQSADRCYHGPITKEGRAAARSMLVQAAQHVGTHPGPLGAFYRRLCRRKNRNVAVVAVARKLVVIAWHLLTQNEPYRYAIPAATEQKLRRLRIRATDQRRPRGHKPGEGTNKPLVPGMRTHRIKALSDVYRDESLPVPQAPPPGERRTIRFSGTSTFLRTIQKTQLVSKPKEISA